jgi:peptidoglycan L-alanyl-D-glutamate endopeptidase CwlK
MTFQLSRRSKERLIGVEEDIVKVVRRAIEITKVDFGVTEGLRTLQKQKEYLERGVTTTLKSKHLEGKAVDLVAYLGSRISWEITLYDDIADAMKQAAIELDVPIRWGAAWHIPDIRKFEGTMQEATDEYVALRISQGRRPFVDAPHFELGE